MSFSLVSIVVPARNEEANVGRTLRALVEQRPPGVELEIVVVNDGSSDRTSEAAQTEHATVIDLAQRPAGGNPAIARNVGFRASRGDPVVFLDCNCVPRAQWLANLLKVHEQGVDVVGGAYALPDGLTALARCDYYCGWYHHHPGRPAGFVDQHPPGNLSVRRQTLASSSGFYEFHPVAYAHEELCWQAEVKKKGARLYFQPSAVVDHYNRAGLGNLLRRSYRWGYSSIEAKVLSGVARFAWLYRYPQLLMLSSFPLAPLATLYVIWCWARCGVLRPVSFLPLVFMARIAHSAGMLIGGISWLRRRRRAPVNHRPEWE